MSVIPFPRCNRRIRGRRLQAIRAEWFTAHPLCARCQTHHEGRVRQAVVLDHKIALENGGPDFDVDNGKNRQGLCNPCHAEKTAEDFAHRQPKKIGADGFPEDDDPQRDELERKQIELMTTKATP